MKSQTFLSNKLSWLKVSDLLEFVDSYPISFCKFKILPESVKALEFAAAGPKALTILFKIGSRLSDSDFDEYITPNFVKLFTSTNRFAFNQLPNQ
jgi:SCY1-like protein 1